MTPTMSNDRAQAAGTTPTDWATKNLRDHPPIAGAVLGDLRGSASEQQTKYEALLQQTAREMVVRQGGTPTKHIAVWRARVSAKPHRDLTEEAREEARQRLCRRLCTVESGDPRSADNDRIDEVRARVRERPPPTFRDADGLVRAAVRPSRRDGDTSSTVSSPSRARRLSATWSSAACRCRSPTPSARASLLIGYIKQGDFAAPGALAMEPLVITEGPLDALILALAPIRRSHSSAPPVRVAACHVRVSRGAPCHRLGRCRGPRGHPA